MKIKNIAGLLASVLVVPTLVPIAVHALPAPVTTVIVRPSNTQGWGFNLDSTTSTPYTFTNDQHSIGAGSLYVPPISTTAADKFIAIKPLNMPAADLTNIAYDFMVAGNGTAASAHQFYLNIYVNQPTSTKYYDCRFDYVPATGSTAGFTTASFASTVTPTVVARHSGSPACPSTLAGMPTGSTVSVVALNLGDSSANDAGLAGYFDKVVIATTTNTTTYDFEKDLTYPASRDDCKNNGWMTFTGGDFDNQGSCVKYVNKHSHTVKGHVAYNAYSPLMREATFNMDTASNSGFFHYVDTTPKTLTQPTLHNKYTVKVSSVKVAGDDAWFAGVVTSATNPSWVGQWLFAKVSDGMPDKLSDSFTTETTALNGVANKTNPADGPFNVLSGDLKVN